MQETHENHHVCVCVTHLLNSKEETGTRQNENVRHETLRSLGSTSCSRFALLGCTEPRPFC